MKRAVFKVKGFCNECFTGSYHFHLQGQEMARLSNDGNEFALRLYLIIDA